MISVLVLLVVLTLVVVAAVRFRRRVSAKPATSDLGHSLRVVSTVTNPTYAKQQPGESSTDDLRFTFDIAVQSPGAVADEDGYLSVSSSTVFAVPCPDCEAGVVTVTAGTVDMVEPPSTTNQDSTNAVFQPQDHTYINWRAATVENPSPPSTPKPLPGKVPLQTVNPMYMAAGDALTTGDTLPEQNPLHKANSMYLAAGNALAKGDTVAKTARVDQRLGDQLLDAAEEGDVDAIQEILREPGSDVNYFSGGVHALFIASTEGHMAAVELLLRSSADVNRLSGGNGKTALLKASVRGHSNVVRLLLDNGAKDIEKTWDHANALFAAAYAGRLDAMRLLIDHGSNMENRLAASPYMKDQDAKYIGTTPLIVASFFNQPGAIELLLSAGADRTARTENGESALDVAASGECRQLLLPEPQN